MSLITAHWSASGPAFLGDYHVEFYATKNVGDITLDTQPDMNDLRNRFELKKNDAFTTATDYGTWHLNHDPRDGSPNIEVGALCMSNATTQVWGNYPYTPAHAWMHAAVIARIAHIKGIDTNGLFGVEVEASVLQNGPIFNVSTHAERAWQTQNPDVDHPERGYFIYSGDPDCRWDLAVLDSGSVGLLTSPTGALQAARESAAWLRAKAHDLKEQGFSDLWGLDR